MFKLVFSLPLDYSAGNFEKGSKDIHIDSVDGGASLGTRCVASPSFIDGDTSDDVGLVSVASVSNGRGVTDGPSDDGVTADASNNSKHNQILTKTLTSGSPV